MDPLSIQPPRFKVTADPADTRDNGRLRKACADFEAIILEKILELGRKTTIKSGLMDGGFAEEMYQSIHDHELAERMSGGHGMGFGEMLYRQISAQHPSHPKEWRSTK